MKALGYTLAVIGILALLVSLDPVQKILKITLSSTIDTILLIVSLAIFIIGILLSIKDGKKKITEVPIYEGKNVVGYRRIAQK